MDMLVAHDWPGNVRELENVIQRSIILADGIHIGVAELPEDFKAIAHADTLILGRKTWQIHGEAFELHLYPLVLGSGKRLFPEGKRINLELIGKKTLPTGVVFQRYRPAR